MAHYPAESSHHNDVFIRCVFRDALLHTSVIMSYCCLAISSKSGHSPLTSGKKKKKKKSTELPLTGYFLCFGPFSVKRRDGCAYKSQ